MVMADSIRELDESVSKITADFTDTGIIPALSTMSLPAAYFAQLPAVFHLRPRLSPVSNVNFVELASFHNFYGNAIKLLDRSGCYSQNTKQTGVLSEFT